MRGGVWKMEYKEILLSIVDVLNEVCPSVTVNHSIDDDSLLGDLGVDSLSLIEILLRLEKKFKVKIGIKLAEESINPTLNNISELIFNAL